MAVFAVFVGLLTSGFNLAAEDDFNSENTAGAES